MRRRHRTLCPRPPTSGTTRRRRPGSWCPQCCRASPSRRPARRPATAPSKWDRAPRAPLAPRATSPLWPALTSCPIPVRTSCLRLSAYLPGECLVIIYSDKESWSTVKHFHRKCQSYFTVARKIIVTFKIANVSSVDQESNTLGTYRYKYLVD